MPPTPALVRVGFSQETLSPLQICSQSEEGNREPPPAAIHERRALFPSEPATSDSSPRNAFWALSLPGVWAGVGSSQHHTPSCNSPSLASACPHLRDHDVSHSLLCSPQANPTAGHACCPQNVPGMCHKPMVPVSTAAPLHWGQPKTLALH